MHKIELLAFVAELGVTTSVDVADAFEIPLNEAACYLKRAHQSGLLRRWRDGRRFEYLLSVTGARKLAYWRDRAPELLESSSPCPPPFAPVPRAFLWCSTCQRGHYAREASIGDVACTCGRELSPVNEGR